jgi:hypothetical protein
MPRSPLGRLRRALKALDIEPCRCKPPVWPPCVHVRKARPHNLSLGRWARLLHWAWPRRYAEPPPPRAPMTALSQSQRAAILAGRAHNGAHLWHDEDAAPELFARLALFLELTGNGNNRAEVTGIDLVDE